MTPLPFVVFSLFTLWDYYIPPYGRVIDYVGLALLVLWLTRRLLTTGRLPMSFSGAHIMIIVASTPAIVAGYLTGGWLTSSAYLTGLLFVYFIYANQTIDHALLRRQLSWLILIHIGFFALQFGLFRGTGFLIDYHSAFGSIEPRVLSLSSGFFRAGGLFQEPNGFCITVFMLVALRSLVGNGKRRLDIVLLASQVAMLLSESLWGIVAAVALLLVAFNVFRLTVEHIVTRVVLGVVLTGTVATIIYDPYILEQIFDPITVRRIMYVQDDGSFTARYLGNLAIAVETGLFFGHGINIDEFPTYFGNNGFSFYVYTFGLLGLLLFILWIAIDGWSDPLRKIFIVLFAVTTYPLFTYASWWAWLGILIRVRWIAAKPATQPTTAGARPKLARRPA